MTLEICWQYFRQKKGQKSCSLTLALQLLHWLLLLCISVFESLIMFLEFECFPLPGFCFMPGAQQRIFKLTKTWEARDITNLITFIIKTHTLDDSVTAHVYPLRLQSGHSGDFVFKNSPMIKCHFISAQTQRWNVPRVNFGRVCCEQKGEATLTVGSIYGNSVTHAAGEALQSLSHWLCWEHPWVPFSLQDFNL